MQGVFYLGASDSDKDLHLNSQIWRSTSLNSAPKKAVSNSDSLVSDVHVPLPLVMGHGRDDSYFISRCVF
jgi:hypothetical protein